jgi:hypothetical protein
LRVSPCRSQTAASCNSGGDDRRAEADRSQLLLEQRNAAASVSGNPAMPWRPATLSSADLGYAGDHRVREVSCTTENRLSCSIGTDLASRRRGPMRDGSSPAELRKRGSSAISNRIQRRSIPLGAARLRSSQRTSASPPSPQPWRTSPAFATHLARRAHRLPANGLIQSTNPLRILVGASAPSLTTRPRRPRLRTRYADPSPWRAIHPPASGPDLDRWRPCRDPRTDHAAPSPHHLTLLLMWLAN